MNIINAGLKFKNLTYGNNPQMIVLHHAEWKVCSVEDIHRVHLNNGWSGIGYHYFIRKDGKVYRGRPEECQGAHTPSVNSKSVGICFEGSYMSDIMPTAQLNAGLELIADIRGRRGNLPVKFHKEISSTDCPGTNFPYDIFRGASAPTNDWLNRLDREVKAQGFTTYPTLKQGASGNITKLMQEKLNKIGYSTNGVDGKFGNGTLSGVKKFQADNKLSVDGIVGRNTWNCLINK